MSVLVIAEPGATHEGDKATMLRLLETAAQCGANAWKPQWTSDPVQMCERRHIGVDHPKRAYYERAYSWLAFPVEWHAEFRDRCHALGMQYACSVYLPRDVWAVEPYVDFYKVASFENGDERLRHTVMATGKRALVSQGIKHERDFDYEWSRGDRRNALLCTSQYPAPLDSLGLWLIQKHNMGGLSDHSRNVIVGAVAVGLGAQIIEAHYRLDTCHPSNPDYAVAFTPAEFAAYIQNIRIAERAIAVNDSARQEAQEWALPYRVTG